jgi:hypothetical protein
LLVTRSLSIAKAKVQAYSNRQLIVRKGDCCKRYAILLAVSLQERLTDRLRMLRLLKLAEISK